jgi:Ca2+-transporting ATPase
MNVDMASRALRTIAMAHRHFNSKPHETEAVEDLEKDLVLDGIVGIIDPLRPDVTDAVKRCQVRTHASLLYMCIYMCV